MHTLLKVSMKDVQAANMAISFGKLQKIMEQVSKTISPETSFVLSCAIRRRQHIVV